MTQWSENVSSAQARELLERRLDELLDGEPIPDDAAELERLALIVTLPARIGPERFAPALTAALEHRDQATLLAAAAALVPALAEAAQAALGRLAERGILPALPPGFGVLRVSEASRLTLADGAKLLMLRLERWGAGRPQVASILLDPAWDPEKGEPASVGAPVIGRALISAPLEPDAVAALLERDGGQPDGEPLQSLALAELERLLADAAARMAELELTVSGEATLALPLLGGAVFGDVGALSGIPITPPGFELAVDPEDADGYARLETGLLAEFSVWVDRVGDRQGPLGRSSGGLAASMLHWKWCYVDGLLGDWSIADLDEYFLEHAPRQLPDEEELIADAVACAAGFFRFLEEVGLLSGDPPELLAERCRQLEAEFPVAARDRTRWGPGKALFTQMKSEGVESTDPATLDAWLEDFNSRPRTERDAVLGPAIGPSGAPSSAPDMDGEPSADMHGESSATHPAPGGAMPIALGWFPAGEYEAAQQRWPELERLWGEIPHPEYCRRMQAALRGAAREGVRPSLVPLRLEALDAFCAERDLDAADARANYTAETARLGGARPWPPGRNEPCWCGSGRKYKKCCGTVNATTSHPLDDPGEQPGLAA